MQGARRQVQAVRHFLEREVRRQGGAQQVAHAEHHLAVAPVQHRDLARRAVEEAGERGLIATQGQLEQVGLQAGHQPRRVETRVLGIDQGVVRRMRRLGVGEAHRVERQAAADEPARDPVQQAQQPFVGKHARRGVALGAEAAGIVEDEFGARAVAPQFDAERRQHDAQEADAALQGLFERGIAGLRIGVPQNHFFDAVAPDDFDGVVIDSLPTPDFASSVLTSEVTWLTKMSWRLPQELQSWANMATSLGVLGPVPVQDAAAIRHRGSLTFRDLLQESPMLSLHQLRCFLTVYEQGSLTAAAEELDQRVADAEALAAVAAAHADLVAAGVGAQQLEPAVGLAARAVGLVGHRFGI